MVNKTLSLLPAPGPTPSKEARPCHDNFAHTAHSKVILYPSGPRAKVSQTDLANGAHKKCLRATEKRSYKGGLAKWTREGIIKRDSLKGVARKGFAMGFCEEIS